MGLRPNVTRAIISPRLGAQLFTITRKTGKWLQGRFVQNAYYETIEAKGNIQPTSAEDLQFFPEGDRRRGMITINSTTFLYETDGEKISDEIEWRGERYRVIRVDRWEDYGFCKAYAQKR